MFTENTLCMIRKPHTDLETRENTSSRMLKKDAQILLVNFEKSQRMKTNEEIDVDEREKHTDLPGCHHSIGKSQTGDIFGMDECANLMKIRLGE
jgi:hypothetical protein